MTVPANSRAKFCSVQRFGCLVYFSTNAKRMQATTISFPKWLKPKHAQLTWWSSAGNNPVYIGRFVGPYLQKELHIFHTPPTHTRTIVPSEILFVHQQLNGGQFWKAQPLTHAINQGLSKTLLPQNCKVSSLRCRDCLRAPVTHPQPAEVRKVVLRKFLVLF